MIDVSALNKILAASMRDFASARQLLSAKEIQRCLGLDPLPPRTELEASTSSLGETHGVTIEGVLFHSRPNWPVPALHFQTSDGGPLVVFLSGVWNDGKASPAVQAFGISLALAGYRVLALEPPGIWNALAQSERFAHGDALNRELCMATPPLGAYVWDCIRALDWAGSTEVAIVGHQLGAEAAMLAFVLDQRCKCAVFSGAGGSLEKMEKLPSSWSGLPGIGLCGDICDIVGAAGDKPVLFLACEEDSTQTISSVERTVEKLNRARKQGLARLESFIGPSDFNRRMRETTIGFVKETFGGKPSRYVYETVPLTDGFVRTSEAGTMIPSALAVIGDSAENSAKYGGAPTATFEELNFQALSEPYPEIEVKLIPWLKYGRLPVFPHEESILISDAPGSPSAIVLPPSGLDLDWLCALGLSQAEFLAQILHLSLPGAPVGWEEAGLSGDPFTAMIASVKTLVSGGELPPVKSARADGPLSSLVLGALRRFRPELTIETSHEASSWSEALELSQLGGLQPGARYRVWTG